MLDIVDTETALSLDGLDDRPEERHVPSGVGLQLHFA